jgi:hypothetical protein
MMATFVLCLAVVAPGAEAQHAKVHRIGYISPGPGPGALTEVFRQGLRDLGYVEGRTS